METLSLLRAGLPGVEREPDFCFAKHTTIGCGGTASACLYPKSAEEAAQTLAFLERHQISRCFLGAGANVLPAEGRFEGAVVRFIRMNTLYACGTHIYAGAGVTLGALLRFACANGLGGLEPLTGIPATVGGATAMNAGVAVRHMGDLVEQVVAVREGNILLLNNAECNFSEKISVFQGGIAVVGVVLNAVRSSRDQIERELCYYRTRRAHLPKGRSMGCVFVNPAGDSAGRIIEACGLKGRRVGGAYVAKEHANFIINGGGTAEDVAKLIEIIKSEVKNQTGISLREEIKRIP